MTFPRRFAFAALCALSVSVVRVSLAPVPAATRSAALTKTATTQLAKEVKVTATVVRPVPIRPKAVTPKKTVRNTRPPKATVAPVTIAPTTILAPSTGVVPTPGVAPTTVILPTLPVNGAGPPTTIAITPVQYVRRALDLVEQYSVRRAHVDLGGLRSRAETKAASVATLAETYPIIREVLAALGDKHSSLLDPIGALSLTQGAATGFGILLYPDFGLFVYPGSEAERAGLRTNDKVLAVNNRPGSRVLVADSAAETLTLRVARANEPAPLEFTARRGPIDTALKPIVTVSGRLGVLDLPGPRGDEEATKRYMQAALDGYRAVVPTAPCGWVVDVRRNTGGFPGPQFVSMSPLLGEGPFFGTIDGAGRIESYAIRNGAVTVDGRVTTPPPAAMPSVAPDLPVAILTSTNTASAGEAAVIALVGRSHMRRFGEPTLGVTSTNAGIRMPDGAYLQVTANYDIDLAGKPYDGPLPPDEVVKVDWTNVGTPADPVLNAARAWLATKGCSG